MEGHYQVYYLPASQPIIGQETTTRTQLNIGSGHNKLEIPLTYELYGMDLRWRVLWGKIFDPKSMISDGKCAVIVYWSPSGYTGYSNGRGTWKTVVFDQKPCTSYNKYLICERKLGMTKCDVSF